MNLLSMDEDFVQSHLWLGQVFFYLLLGFFKLMFAGLILLLIRTVIEYSESNVNRG